MQLLVINDNFGNFLPVLGFSLSELSYSFREVDGIKTGSTQFTSSVNYFNALAGVWEPAVEQFRLNLKYEQNPDTSKTYRMELGQKKPENLADAIDQEDDNDYEDPLNMLNINLTEGLLRSCADTMESLRQGRENSEIQEHHLGVLHSGQKSRLAQQRQLIDFSQLDETSVLP